MNTETKPFQFPTSERPQTSERAAEPVAQEPSEAALDHAVEESFPASDPVSVSVSRAGPSMDGPQSQQGDAARPRHGDQPPEVRAGALSWQLGVGIASSLLAVAGIAGALGFAAGRAAQRRLPRLTGWNGLGRR